MMIDKKKIEESIDVVLNALADRVTDYAAVMPQLRYLEKVVDLEQPLYQEDVFNQDLAEVAVNKGYALLTKYASRR